MDENEKQTEETFISWYEDVCNERLSMLEAEEAYKRRISELEENSAALLKAFEEVQAEVTILRSKYEPPENGDVYKEPYMTVYTERQTLLNTENGYKKRIKSLNNEISTLQEYIKGLDIDTTQVLKTKEETQQRHKALLVITSSERLQFLEIQNQKLKFRIEDIEYELAFLREQNRTLEQKLNDIESVSKTCANQWTQLHKAIKGKGNRVNVVLPKLPEEESSFRQNVKAHASQRSSGMSLPSIKRTSATAGLMFGLDYRTIHKGRSLSRRSVSTDKTSSSFEYVY